MIPGPWETAGRWTWRDMPVDDDYAALIGHWKDGTYHWTVWDLHGDFVQDGRTRDLEVAKRHADATIDRAYPVEVS